MKTYCPNCRAEKEVALAIGQVWLRVDTGALYVLEELPNSTRIWAAVRRMDLKPGDWVGCDPAAYCALWPDHIAAGKWIAVTNFDKASKNASIP